MGQWLRANPQADSFTFGMALNSPVAQAALRGVPSSNATGGSTDLAGTPAGVVHMLQPDRSSFVDSSIAWAQVNNSLNAQDDPQDWTVAFDGWTLVTDDGTNSHTKQITANIDPLYQGLYLPLDQASLIRTCYFYFFIVFRVFLKIVTDQGPILLSSCFFHARGEPYGDRDVYVTFF